MKVSVIIPAYNVENYIERCIKSIIEQTYDNLEIIIVNDGSTDQSLNIINKYLSDKRVIIITKKNGGLSDARNCGLAKCKGDYVMFVDGDDYLETNTIKVLVSIIKSNDNVDLILFPYKKLFKNKFVKTYLFDKDYIEFTETDVKSQIYATLVGPNSNASNISPIRMDRLNTAWGKLYKRNIIDKLRFTDTKIIGPEDCWFNIQAIKNCKKAIYTSEIYYVYEKNNFSSLLHKYNPDLLEKRWNMYKLVESFLVSMGDNILLWNLCNRVIFEQFNLLRNICLSDLNKREKKRELYKLLNDPRYIPIWDKVNLKKLTLGWQLFFIICKEKQALLIQIIFKCIYLWKTVKGL